MMDITKALEFYCKGFPCEWSIGETYESLDWKESNELPKPEEWQLEKAWEAYKVEREKNKYKRLRSAAYPSIEEQLDILYHEGIEGWRDYILAIKNAYPKEDKLIEKKPENLIEARISKMEENLKNLINNFDSNKNDNIDLKSSLKEINEGLVACKGFLMMIPDLQKSVIELQTKLKSN